MKTKIIFIIIVCILFRPGKNFSQSWRDMLDQKGLVNFQEVRKKFYEEQKQKKYIPETEGEEPYENEQTFFSRWEWYNQIRLDEHGNLTNPVYRSLLEELKLQSKKNLSPDAISGDWTFAAPDDMSTLLLSKETGLGRINCITFQGTKIFVGSATGGAWFKDFFIPTPWLCITNSIPNLSISSICITPSGQDTIYLLTGDGDGGQRSSIGVLKSTDGGLSWLQIGLSWNDSNGMRTYKMIMNPDNHNQLFVVGDMGILKSDNGGLNWNTTFSGGRFTDIEFKPGNPNIMYAVNTRQFFLSTNNGGVWNAVSLTGLDTSKISRMAIAVTSGTPKNVFVIAGSKQLPAYLGLWKSTNSGASFPNAVSTSPDILSDNGANQTGYDLSFAVNPSNVSDIYAGTIDTWNSTNGGTTWSKISSHYQAGNDNMHPDQHAAEFNGTDLWVGNDGGIYQYDPGSSSTKWKQQWQGLGIAQYYKLGLDPTGGDANYMGAQDNGMQRYDFDAKNELVGPGDGGEVAVDWSNTHTYYYEINATLQKSCFPDACDKTPYSVMAACNCPDTAWTQSFAGGNVIPTRPIVVDPLNHDTVYTGFNCLYVSANGADNFTRITSAPCDDGTYIGLKIAVGLKWALKAHKVIRETSPNTWSDVTSNLPVSKQALTGLEADRTDPLTAWVTFGGYTDTIKVYKTSNGGTSWTRMTNNGLPNVPMTCVVHQQGIHHALYVGTDIGVFYTDDVVGKWIPFRNGMPSVVVDELEIDATNRFIYAATFGRGLWYSHLVGVCPVSLSFPTATADFAFSYHEASDSIFSGEMLDDGIGQNTVYNSGRIIQLSPPFDAINGTQLYAYIDGCSQISPKPRLHDGYYAGQMEQSYQPVNEQNKNITVKNYSEARLGQNIPNPFSHTTTINYTLPQQYSSAKIIVVDEAGKTIKSINLSGVGKGSINFSSPFRAGASYRYSLYLDGKLIDTKQMEHIK